MKVCIKLPRKLISIWKKELKDKKHCKEHSGVDRQTIDRALATGQCTRYTMDRLNVYILRERNKRNVKLTKLISK